MYWYGNLLQPFNSRSVIKFTLAVLFVCNRCWLVSGDGGKIIGGRDAKRGEFPSTLCYRGFVRCGATLVTLDKVLTAGSCFTPDEVINYVAMFGGAVDFRDSGKEKQEIYLKDIKRHSKYENRSTPTGYYVVYDIAMGFLEGPYVESDTLKPAVFPANDEAGMKKYVDQVKREKNPCLSSGYGAVEKENPVDSVSFILKVLDIRLLPDDDCGMLPEMKGKEICGTSLRESDQTYVGDTGSTLTCGGQIIAMTKSYKNVDKGGKKIVVTTFTLFGPHLVYFGLAKDEGRMNHRFHPVIFLSLLVMLYRSSNECL